MPGTGEIKAAKDALADLMDLLGSSGVPANDRLAATNEQPKAKPEVKNNSGTIVSTFVDDGPGPAGGGTIPSPATATDASLDSLMDAIGGAGSGDRVMPAVALKPKPQLADTSPRVFRPANPPRGRPVSSGGG
jgi:hypothetical protein